MFFIVLFWCEAEGTCERYYYSYQSNFYYCVCYPFFLNVPFCHFSRTFLSLMKIFFVWLPFKECTPTFAMCLCCVLPFQWEVSRHLHNQTSSGTSGFSPPEQIVVTSSFIQSHLSWGRRIGHLAIGKAVAVWNHQRKKAKSFHRRCLLLCCRSVRLWLWCENHLAWCSLTF